MINTFENCNCQGSCKQDGLLHWEILKSDYLTLNDDYKDCGIVYFVKEKPDSKTGIIIRNNVVYNGEKDSEDYKEVYVVENLPEEGKKQSVYINNQIAYSWNGESYERVNLIKGDKGDILISDGIDWAAPVDLSIYPPEKGEGAATYAIINKNGGGIQLNNGEEISTPNLKWTGNGWFTTQNSFDGKYCLEVKDSAQVLFDKGAKVGIRDSAYHIQDGNTSFVMHDNAAFQMSGCAKVKINSNSEVFIDSGTGRTPRVYLHSGTVVFEPTVAGSVTTEPVRNENYSYFDNYSFCDGGPVVIMGGKPVLEMQAGAALSMKDKSQVFTSGYSTVYLKDCPRIDIENASRIHITGLSTSINSPGLSPLINIDPKQLVITSQNVSTFGRMGGSISIPYEFDNTYKYLMNGVSFDSAESLLNGTISGDTVPPAGDPYYSLLMQGSTKVIIGGEGNTMVRMCAGGGGTMGFDLTTNAGSNFQVKAGCYGGAQNLFDITSQSGSIVKVKFGADGGAQAQYLIDPGAGSRVWYKFGAGSGAKVKWVVDPASGSNLDLKISPSSGNSMKILLTDGIFAQMTAKSHVEMHDESAVVMRGPWVKKSESLSNPEEIIKKKPWLDCQNYEGWRRPVSIKNGPLNSMYDQSGFMMRGVWDLTKDALREEQVTITLNEDVDGEIINSAEDLTIDMLVKSETFKNWQKKQNKYYDKEIADSYPWPEEETEEGQKNEIVHEVGQKTVTIKNYIYTTCPPDWKPFIDKVEDSPLVQITDNANIRISEHFTMTADDSGITIVVPPAKSEEIEEESMAAEAPKEKEEKKITFTYEQLQKLLEIVNERIEQNKNKEE